MSQDTDKILNRAAEDLLRQTEGKTSTQSLEAYRRFRRLEEHRLRLRIAVGASGRDVVRQRSDLVDILCRRLFAQVCAETFGRMKPHDFAVLAFGGYGRQEMNPYSDVDIMFLHADEQPSDRATLATQNILRMLWDIGFKVGHSVRSIPMAITQANTDLKTKTALLEARWLCGDRRLVAKFRREFERQCVKGHEASYITWRLADQNRQHERHGTTFAMQEPNIKEGAGGLRDAQSLQWIGYFRCHANSLAKLVEKKFLTDNECRLLEKAYDFLLSVRTQMHFINKRSTDMLTLHLQGQVATRMGYPQKHVLQRVEEFMRDYYQQTRTIQRITDTAVQRMVPELKPARIQRLLGLLARRSTRTERFDGFFAKGGELFAESSAIFNDDSQRLMRVFQHAQVRQLTLSYELRDLIRKQLGLVNRTFQYSLAAREVFLAILSRKGQVGRILRFMHETDFLGRYLPEFGKLTCLVQHEFFHRYTADEHTLLCLDKLDALIDTENPKLAGYRVLFQQCESPSILYLALLMHDTGKAQGRRHHEEASATLAARVARRLQLPPEWRRTLVLLVDNHSLLSKTAQSRNLDDPATISHFAEMVQTSRNLNGLMLVTLADGQGTSDAGWSDWKEAFVWQLYHSTRAYLENGETALGAGDVNIEEMRREVSEKLGADYTDELLAHFGQMPERYFYTFDVNAIVAHIRIFRAFYEQQWREDATGLKPALAWKHHPDQGHSEVLVCGWDRPGLVARLCGAFLAAKINVLSADIHTRGDNLVLDRFQVCDAKHSPVINERDHRMVEKLIGLSSADPAFDFTPHIAKARRYAGYSLSQEVDISTRITIDNHSHPSFTIVDIATPDRLGLLYDLFAALTQIGLSLVLARITTEKEVAIDTFYLVHADNGEKVMEDQAVRHLQRTLQEAAVPAQYAKR